MSTLGKESIDYMHGRPVHKNKSYQQKGKQPATQPNTQKPTPTTGDDCHWCGAKPAHPRKTCPAREAKCSRCKKNGHYGHKCQSSKSKSINEVQDEDYVNVAFLGEVQSSTNAFWTADLHVNKHPTSFKLDSGAGVTIISEKLPGLSSSLHSQTHVSFVEQGTSTSLIVSQDKSPTLHSKSLVKP